MRITSANDDIHQDTHPDDDGTFTIRGLNDSQWDEDHDTAEGHNDKAGSCPGGCPGWTHYGPQGPVTGEEESARETTYGHVWDHTPHGGGYAWSVGEAFPGGRELHGGVENSLDEAMDRTQEHHDNLVDSMSGDDDEFDDEDDETSDDEVRTRFPQNDDPWVNTFNATRRHFQ